MQHATTTAAPTKSAPKVVLTRGGAPELRTSVSMAGAGVPPPPMKPAAAGVAVGSPAGVAVGASVGVGVGDTVGVGVGDTVGVGVGDTVGVAVGVAVGDEVGENEAKKRSPGVGAAVGRWVARGAVRVAVGDDVPRVSAAADVASVATAADGAGVAPNGVLRGG